MTAVWITSDLHLGHAKIIDYERHQFDNIEEHDQCILDNWLSRVRKRDVVYVLGDVAWTEKALKRFSTLPGLKKLVMGNHDGTAKRMEKARFTSIRSVAQIGPRNQCGIPALMLTHVPVHPESIRGKVNVHGHVHSNTLNDERYFNACLEANNMTPVSLEEVLP